MALEKGREIMLENIQVKKRDGSLENFDQAKIARVAVATGIDTGQGQQLAANVASWIESLGQPTVTSQQIRDKVVEELQKVNPNAARLYTWYEKTNDKQ